MTTRTRKQARDSLRIPALSGSTSALMALPPTAEDYFDSVLALVSSDPGLGTRLLGIANSALMSRHDSTSDPARALMRVGPRRFVSLVVGGAVADVFDASTPELEHLLLHTKAVAALNYRLASEIAHFDLDPHVARTLGLLHNIGALVMASSAPEEYARILRRHNLDSRAILIAEQEELGLDHCEAGLEVAERWSLPAPFADVIGEHHAPRDAEDQPAGPALAMTRLSLRLQRVLACGRDDGVGRAVALRSVKHEASRSGLHFTEDRIRNLLERALDDLLEETRVCEPMA